MSSEKPRQLLVATTNQAKFKEAVAVLQTKGLEILGLHDFPLVKKIEETGRSFAENALLKAEGYYQQTGIPTIADDGGLMVDYLNGAPGLHSRRWFGYQMTDEELVKAVLEKLKDVPKEKRTAKLGGVIIFYDGKHLLQEENWLKGYIAEKLMIKAEVGLPYRAILMIPQFNKPYGALTEAEHEQVNFRRRTLKALKPKILQLFEN